MVVTDLNGVELWNLAEKDRDVKAKFTKTILTEDPYNSWEKDNPDNVVKGVSESEIKNNELNCNMSK